MKFSSRFEPSSCIKLQVRGNLPCIWCIKTSVLARVFTYRHSALCQPRSSFRSHCIYRMFAMRGLTISSLVFILALSSTVAVAAPRAAVSPVPNIASSTSCKISGHCSIFNPEICCGACELIDNEAVGRDACSQPFSILINLPFHKGFCRDDNVTCKMHGACNILSPPRTCCGSCILIDAFTVSPSQDACSLHTPQHILINFLFI